MFLRFDELYGEKLQKLPHFVKKHENSSIWPKLCNFFQRTTMSLHFDQLFGKKLQKVPHFVKQHEKSLIWPKLCNFWNKLQCLFPFDELSRKKLQEVRRLVKKHEKSSMLSTCNFPRKLPCFDVSMNIAAKSCKKLLVPWKRTKNHQFGQIFATFPTNFDVFAFRWIFKEKVAKSSVKKHEKSSIWPKLCNFSSKLPCFGISMKFSAKSYKKCLISWKSTKNRRFGENSQLFQQTTMFDALVNFSAKSCRKCLVFWQNSKNHRLGQNLQLFRTKYHVYAFRWTFQQKVAKSASFRKKARNIVDSAKAWNFSNKLPCFGISMNFSGKKCKKWPVSWKTTNTHRFGQNLKLLEETTMFWHFDDYCKKKLQKGGKSGSFREKWRKIIDLG